MSGLRLHLPPYWLANGVLDSYSPLAIRRDHLSGLIRPRLPPAGGIVAQSPICRYRSFRQLGKPSILSVLERSTIEPKRSTVESLNLAAKGANRLASMPRIVGETGVGI